MRRDLRAGLVAQRMRQPFSVGLQRGLGDVVAEIAGWRGDALLGAGVDDHRRRALRQHPSAEGLHAVHDAPEVDVDQLLPGVEIFPRLAGIVADAGIVHQERNLAEFFVSLVGERRQIFRLATRRRRRRAPCRRRRQPPRPPLPRHRAPRPRGRRARHSCLAPARRLAVASPMPLAAPVMTAVRPRARAGMFVVSALMFVDSIPNFWRNLAVVPRLFHACARLFACGRAECCQFYASSQLSIQPTMGRLHHMEVAQLVNRILGASPRSLPDDRRPIAPPRRDLLYGARHRRHAGRSHHALDGNVHSDRHHHRRSHCSYSGRLRSSTARMLR